MCLRLSQPQKTSCLSEEFKEAFCVFKTKTNKISYVSILNLRWAITAILRFFFPLWVLPKDLT